MPLNVSSTQRYAYPLFLDMRGRRAVVVGGGGVALRKIETLLEHGADVSVVALSPNECIRELAANGAISLVERAWAEGDFDGATLVFCCTGDLCAEKAMLVEAARVGCLANVVDAPELCDFTVPSLVSRGPLRIAVSTSGASPLEAKRVRQALEDQFDESWGAYLDLLGQVRVLVKQRIENEDDRRAVFEAVSDAGWRQRIAAGDVPDAEGVFAAACSDAKVVA